MDNEKQPLTGRELFGVIFVGALIINIFVLAVEVIDVILEVIDVILR